MAGSRYGKRIIYGEVMGFFILILLLWIDEIADLPHLLLRAEATPVNIEEAAFEMFLVLILAAVVIGYTRKTIKEIRTLKGLLPICANCKKIRDDQGYWQQIEVYLSRNSEADFSHCICPECAKTLYPEYDLYES